MEVKVLDCFDNEQNIIKAFQECVEEQEIIFVPETQDTIRLFKSIHLKKRWKNWKDTSGKDAPPPDFFSDRYKIMMDVMRVDDHTFKNKKGKLVNPTQAKSTEIFKKLNPKGHDNLQIFTIVDSGLPTYLDHNYTYYRDSFIRVIEQHKQKIELYRRNHPDFKLVFFVFDESSAYMENLQNTTVQEFYKSNPEQDTIIRGRPHYWWIDRDFLNCFLNTGIDYLIWYTPFKASKYLDVSLSFERFKFPQAIVFDLNNLDIKNLDTKKYNEKYMIGAEA